METVYCLGINANKDGVLESSSVQNLSVEPGTLACFVTSTISCVSGSFRQIKHKTAHTYCKKNYTWILIKLYDFKNLVRHLLV